MATWTTKRNPDGSARFEMVSSDIDKATRVDPTNDIINAQHDELRKFSEANAARTAEAEQAHINMIKNRVDEVAYSPTGKQQTLDGRYDVTLDANRNVSSVSYLDNGFKRQKEAEDISKRYGEQAETSKSVVDAYRQFGTGNRDIAETIRAAEKSARETIAESLYGQRDPSTYSYDSWKEKKYFLNGNLGGQINAAMYELENNPTRFLTDKYEDLSYADKIAWNMSRQRDAERDANIGARERREKDRKLASREKERNEWWDSFLPTNSFVENAARNGIAVTQNNNSNASKNSERIDSVNTVKENVTSTDIARKFALNAMDPLGFYRTAINSLFN